MTKKNEILKLWVEKADSDLGTAKIIYLHLPKFKDTLAYHCQQASEKYLKALLIFFGLNVPKSHDIIYHLGLLEDKIDIGDNLFKKASILNDYSVEVRYPDSIIELTSDDCKEAIEIADEFRNYAINILPAEYT
jgi:HEPN domain-containing protein